MSMSFPFHLQWTTWSLSRRDMGLPLTPSTTMYSMLSVEPSLNSAIETNHGHPAGLRWVLWELIGFKRWILNLASVFGLHWNLYRWHARDYVRSARRMYSTRLNSCSRSIPHGRMRQANCRFGTLTGVDLYGRSVYLCDLHVLCLQWLWDTQRS